MPDLPDHLEDRVLDLLGGPAEDVAAGIEALCEEFPEHGNTLRQQIQAAEQSEAAEPSPREPILGRELGANAPKEIGPYRIVSVLGQGGMGTVYLAEQSEPVARSVALKVIKLGMDSARILARFEAERKALARMSHDNIARVFDAGTSERGQPWFAMEYVEGTRITDHCDRARLSIQARLRLFLQVCAGVQHAHVKGVIHRDLKPSNILIRQYHDRAVPKIIDFGLARAVEGRLGDRSVHTMQGRFVGTPEYMSPEQAGGADAERRDIDTRSDVYSLGAVLFEILTGEVPLTRLSSQRPERIVERLEHEEPGRVSSRVNIGGPYFNQMANVRGTDMRGLFAALRGDLDWICARALEKERSRRYQTASELMRDIERHLHHEPVRAGPPSATYRIGKLVRRNRGKVIVGVLSAALLAMLTVFLVVQNVRSERERKLEAEARAALGFRLLGIDVRLETAQAAADRLLPAWPDAAPALREWLAQLGTPLVEELPQLRAALANLDQQGQRVPSADASERTAEIESLEVTLSKIERGEDLRLRPLTPSERELYTDRLRGELQRKLLQQAAASELQIDDDAKRYLARRLTNLIPRVEQFRDRLMSDVAQRLQWAKSIETRSITQYRDRWQQVQDWLSELEADPESSFLVTEYRGLHLEPQVGMVPIGIHPDTGLLEFMHLGSTESNRKISMHGGSERTLRVRDGIVFVLLPGGTPNIGSRPTDVYATQFEFPTTAVQLDPFFIAKHEVSAAQWQRLGGSPREDDPETPATYVTWSECSKLVRRHGLDLPTEAQWEYGCRAGSEGPWSLAGEATAIQRRANIGNKADTKRAFLGNANDFGLIHVHGNVAEWCRDWYGSYRAPAGDGDGLRHSLPSFWANPWTDPTTVELRVVRGGSFRSDPVAARSGARLGVNPEEPSVEIGLRPVRRLFR